MATDTDANKTGWLNLSLSTNTRMHVRMHTRTLIDFKDLLILNKRRKKYFWCELSGDPPPPSVTGISQELEYMEYQFFEKKKIELMENMAFILRPLWYDFDVLDAFKFLCISRGVMGHFP